MADKPEKAEKPEKKDKAPASKKESTPQTAVRDQKKQSRWTEALCVKHARIGPPAPLLPIRPPCHVAGKRPAVLT